MKSVIYPSFLLFLLLLAQSTSAQQVVPSNTNRLTGKILDVGTNKALSFASVAVFEQRNGKDSLLTGSQANGEGVFVVSNLPSGSLTMRVTFVGYQTLEQTIRINQAQTDVGTLALKPDASMLKEVNVTGEKSAISMTMEKRTFNVAKNLTTIGGTAENVLKNVPSITLDESGNPSLRNMATTIYVNGKPTQLTLSQIPANQIESVEVISNPSARYDASTSGGIVNLVLKKNRLPGYNGLVSAGIGNNSRFDGTVNIDWRKGKWNLTSFYSINATRNPITGYVNRTNRKADGSPLNYFTQTTSISLNNTFQSGRIAADYALNNRNTLSLAGTVVGGAFNTVSAQPYTYLDLNQTVTSSGNRTTVPQNAFTNMGLEFDWKHQFARKGRELSLVTSYSRNHFSNAADWLTTALDAGGNSQSGFPERDKITGRTNGNQIIAQLDYTHPLGDSAKLEMGLRSYTFVRDQQYFFNKLNNDTQAYQLLPSYSQDARIAETVNAIYALYTRQFRRNISLQAGLRLEQSSLHGTSRLDTTTFGYNYPSANGQNLFQSLFPSFALSKKLNETDEIGINLSRKVGRPNFRQLFIGIQSNDRQNITIGNPALRPEFVNTAEVNYNKSFGSVSWLATAYYIYEDHTIKPFTQPSSTDSSVLVTTFVNVKADIRYGFDNTLKFNIGPNLSAVANINVFNVILQSVNLQNQLVSYNAKLNLTYRLPANISAQLTGTNDGKAPSLQGYRQAVRGVDFAIRKGFWANRASLTFSVNDMFNSRRFISIYDQPGAYQVSMNRREVRFYKLSLQLPLGSDTAKRNQRKMDRPDVDFSN
ncbi:outer membrane beta-barrel family protein [Spirosoma pollinicola]|uniref:TonB-dependent receptor n=1 Tax=Spirosoma pollinicola TaxID=2057025 RepID=A0A2K8YWC4_9BACT|nr:outer membrane beta-barrel family protein [Spirosoma pollinicola]AUD01899.1 TonB-dependent receptor [Spirosoma pollinicola]